MSDWSDDDNECQDIYDFLRELNTGAYEGAATYHDPAYRCFHIETHGTEADFHELTHADKWSYQRPPRVRESRVPSGMYFRYNPFTKNAMVLTEQQAKDLWWTSFESL